MGTIEILDDPVDLDDAIIFQNKLFFPWDDGSGIGNELYMSDGTTLGTQLVLDINSMGDGSPGQFTILGDELIFSASDGISGGEIWETDGTPQGTQRVSDIVPGNGGASISNIFAFKNLVYFRADDNIVEDELWVSDGTMEGTRLLFDLDPTRSSFPDMFNELNGELLFTADNVNDKKQLFVLACRSTAPLPALPKSRLLLLLALVAGLGSLLLFRLGK